MAPGYRPVLQQPIKRLLQVLVMAATLVQAVYYLDDTNPYITYSDEFFGRNGEDQGPEIVGYDFERMFNHTMTRGVCRTDQNCTMNIPFKGSGITLYFIRFFPFNFTATIDGIRSTTFLTMGGRHVIHNVSFYDIQSLSYGDHTLLINLFDVTIPAGNDSTTRTERSTLDFDYAAVNDTDPNPGSGSANPASSSSQPANPASSQPATSAPPTAPVIGGTIGGVVGGMVLMALIIILVVRHRKRRSSRRDAGAYSEPPDPDSNANPMRFDSGRSLPTHVVSRSIAESPPTTTNDHMVFKFTTASQPLIDSDGGAFHLSETEPSPSTPPLAQTMLGPLVVGPPPQHPMPMGTFPAADGRLSPEEYTLLRGLHSRNVPLEEIVDVMRMMREERAVRALNTSSPEELSGRQADVTSIFSAPPDYVSYVRAD